LILILPKVLVKTFDLRENVSLGPLTTLGIGGAARYFVEARSDSDVAEAVKFSRDRQLKLFVLGGGSNVLIADNGFDGLVLQVGVPGIAEAGGLITAGAGEEWDEFVAYCVKHELAGVECLSGIPGFIGGTPVQNVGAYGQEVSGTIVSVRCFDREGSKFVTLANAECGFTYRTSVFNSTRRDRYVVLDVTFRLVPGGQPKIVYKDLIEHFAGRTPSLAEVREAVLAIRSAKSMVIDAADPNSKSAGSFFKNPVVDRRKLEDIRTLVDHVPYFEFGERVKIPAAWLIERSGFEKGFALGNAGISTKHTLALINRGYARSSEIIALKEMIQRSVGAKFGIDLEPEPVFVGF
jgi:UDP-N-acetylmuramate dehydrogenase